MMVYFTALLSIFSKLLVIIIVCQTAYTNSILAAKNDIRTDVDCESILNSALKSEISNYSSIAKTIINEFIYGSQANTTFNYLQEFVDKFGSRFTGTKNLENAIDYMLQKSIDSDLKAFTENVTVPQWVRGKEYATMLTPRVQNLNMLGLGYSVGTSKQDIIAEAVVFTDFDQMELNKEKVNGKIVVFNEEWVSYGKTVIYRSKAASRAAKYGAVATLVRSVTPFSMNTPHTGMQTYDNNVTKIPVACITVEDAKLLHRLYKKGENITIKLYMDAENREPTTSRNLIVDLKGSQKPEKIVLVSGHLDSWDVGAGAMDDGGGAFISWNTVRVLKSLKLKPRRTIRAVLWTAEEMGTIGSDSYFNDHKSEIQNYNLVMESDIGTFRPYGVQFSGNDFGYCVVKQIVDSHFDSIKVSQTDKTDDIGPDVNIWVDHGVPGATIMQKNDRYFWFHHTNADRIEVQDPDDMNLCTAVWAVVSYICADLSQDLH